jgi:hypothetical protein
MSNPVRILIQLSIFSIAMAYIEAAVVVYLRELYYPDGFAFPLVPMDVNIAIVEVWREAATIIMLVVIGIIAGKNSLQRFSFFIYCFAVWDIFYYVFLKISLDWPQSLLTWDILFLIPVPWVGPVLTPIIISFTMIFLTLTVIVFERKGFKPAFSPATWILLITGAFIVIYSFNYDYILFLKDKELTSPLWKVKDSNNKIFSDLIEYMPGNFNWFLFISGELIILSGIAVFIFQTLSNTKSRLNYLQN